MSDDQKPGPSMLTCVLVGLGGAAVVGVGLTLLAGKSGKVFGALHGAAGELERATADYDAAFRRLLAAEAALEPISKAFLALEWEETDAHLPRLRAAQAEVRAAKAAADAAMKRMRDWGEVVRLERKPATTEAGREADKLINELDEPRHGN